MDHSTDADRRLDEIQEWAQALDVNVERVATPAHGSNASKLVAESYGRPTDISYVGSGVASVLPILVQGSLMEPKDILLIEEPEAHLHPKAMAGLLRYFHHLVRRDVQVICTTHSLDFLVAMDRLRRADEPQLPDDTKIFHVSRDRKPAVEEVVAPGFGPLVNAIDHALSDELGDTPVGSWLPGPRYPGWTTIMD